MGWQAKQADWSTLSAMAAVTGITVWLAFVYLPTGTYWSPDTGYRRLQVDNIRFIPELDLSINYPGQWLDPQIRFAPFGWTMYFVREARVYFVGSPVIAILGKPFVRLVGERGALVVPVLAGLYTAFLVARLSRQVAGRYPWLATLLCGLATPMLIYSLAFWEHSLATAAGLTAFVLVAGRNNAPRLRNYLFSGVLAGAAVSIREEMLLFALVLAFAVIGLRPRSARGAGLWLGACVLMLGVSAMRNYHISQDFVPPDFHIIVPKYRPDSYLGVHGLRSLAYFIFDPTFGALGSLLVGAVGAYWIAGRHRRVRLRAAIQILALLALGVGIGYFFVAQTPDGELHGLLSGSPFIVLGLVPLAGTPAATNELAGRLRLVAIGYFAIAALSVGLLTRVGVELAGIEWGSRYALITFPLCVPLVVQTLLRLLDQATHAWSARLHLIVAFGLIGLSGFAQWLGVTEMRDSLHENLARKQAILALPEQQILTDLWWISTLGPDLFRAKEFFLSEARGDWTDWIRTADARGLSEFAVISYIPLTVSERRAIAPPGRRLEIVETRRASDGMVLMRVRLLADPEP